MTTDFFYFFYASPFHIRPSSRYCGRCCSDWSRRWSGSRGSPSGCPSQPPGTRTLAGGAGGGVRRFNIAPRTLFFFFSQSQTDDPAHTSNKTHAVPTVPVMELRTSLEKDVSTEWPWRVTDVTPPPMLRSSREPWWRWRRRRHDWMFFLCFDDKTNWSFHIRHLWSWQKSSFKDLSLSYLGTVSVILVVSYFSCVSFPFNSCTLCFCNFSWPCTACVFKGYLICIYIPNQFLNTLHTNGQTSASGPCHVALCSLFAKAALTSKWED